MDALYDSFLQKFHAVFTHTEEKERIFRFREYTLEELSYMDVNFILFGVYEVLSCVFEYRY